MANQGKGNLLIIFGKYPEAGQVKTRLAKSIGDSKAAEAYKRLMDFTLDVSSKVDCDVCLCYAGDKTVEEWNEKVTQVETQEGNDLGERMITAFDKGFSAGYERIVLIGSDCAELREGIIEEAFEALEYNEVTIGPAEDGGYYLIGTNQSLPVLFTNMEWSTDEVFETTFHRIRWAKVGAEFLEKLSDVDEFVDAQRVPWLKDLL